MGALASSQVGGGAGVPDATRGGDLASRLVLYNTQKGMLECALCDLRRCEGVGQDDTELSEGQFDALLEYLGSGSGGFRGDWLRELLATSDTIKKVADVLVKHTVSAAVCHIAAGDANTVGDFLKAAGFILLVLASGGTMKKTKSDHNDHIAARGLTHILSAWETIKHTVERLTPEMRTTKVCGVLPMTAYGLVYTAMSMLTQSVHDQPVRNGNVSIQQGDHETLGVAVSYGNSFIYMRVQNANQAEEEQADMIASAMVELRNGSALCLWPTMCVLTELANVQTAAAIAQMMSQKTEKDFQAFARGVGVGGMRRGTQERNLNEVTAIICDMTAVDHVSVRAFANGLQIGRAFLFAKVTMREPIIGCSRTVLVSMFHLLAEGNAERDRVAERTAFVQAAEEAERLVALGLWDVY